MSIDMNQQLPPKFNGTSTDPTWIIAVNFF